MTKYKVLYIDEQEEEREIFESLRNDDLDILTKHPYPTEDEMMEYIWNEKFDAVIVDYGLMKNDPRVKYKGNDILERINNDKEDFPALIFTQDITQDDGVDEKVLSTKILLKDDLNLEKPEPFQRKIKNYIKYYRKESKDLSAEFDALLKKKKSQNGVLNDADLQRLNYLDGRIERRLNGKRVFPDLLKDSQNLKYLNDVIKEADVFLKSKLKK